MALDGAPSGGAVPLYRPIALNTSGAHSPPGAVAGIDDAWRAVRTSAEGRSRQEVRPWLDSAAGRAGARLAVDAEGKVATRWRL